MRFNYLFFAALLAGSGVAHELKDTGAAPTVNCKWEGTAPSCFPKPCLQGNNPRLHDLQWSDWGDGPTCTKGYKRCCCADDSDASKAWCRNTNKRRE